MNVKILLLFLCLKNIVSVKIQVEQGWLEGEILVPSTGKGRYYSFKGIPYAEPPLGKLRFMPPQPPANWYGIRNATQHGSVCIQYESYANRNTVLGNEDCLYLNVYSPNIKPSKLLPVMFFIHGGNFVTGSGNDDLYAPDFLMDYNIVLVTINYRLNSLGFLTANIKEASGNAGLKDQVAALKWVNTNIKNFGGDPKRVTIFGDSAGGASVTLHMISPIAKELFQRVIAMSGVWMFEFSNDLEPHRRAFVLGKKLGCDTNDPYKLIDFLQKQPAEDLILIQPDVYLSDKAYVSLANPLYFLPVVEKKFGNDTSQFLTECPLFSTRSNSVSKADILIGHTALEGLHYAYITEGSFLKYYPNYKELLVPLKIHQNRSPKTVLKLADKIQDFYFGKQSISSKTLRQLIECNTYIHIVYDVHAFIENLYKHPSSRRFFYNFAIFSSRNYYSIQASKFNIKKATHMDDLVYLFDGSGYNITVDVNGQAFKYVQLMCKLYTNFAKYGTPTPDNSLGLIWPEYDPRRSAVQIGRTGNLSTITVSYNTNTSIGFWHQLYQSAGFNL